MDEQRAIKLLNETFNKDFEINRFIRFVKELFNDFAVNQKECTKFIASQYKEYIASFEKIGDYENARKSMEVLVVQLNKTSSRDRARTMQRNFIANWLGKTEKDAALVAFYGDDPQDWRFSFVKMEYKLAEVEPGNVKAVKELTPAKRYSFLVGVNEPNHTCRRQFLELVQQEDINPTLEEIEKAFSIDNVTKEFFLEYKELYFGLKKSLEEVIEQDPYVKKEFEEKDISTVDFAKKLLGQIVFIYFLQKKGWLGVEVNKEWGSGPKDFMRRLFGDKKKGIMPMESYKNFFNDILEPLFYEALANPREADDGYYSRFNCKIPFLNGGLFEPINDYDWVGTEIVLDNSVFEKILKTFDQYNFTVKEDEPLEKEVAIDPEMLGKVFENLLDIKDRKSTGRYYTPREIVHYMCQQSMINYLATNSPISIPRDDIEKFIQLGDFALDLTIRAQEQKRQYHGKTFKIDESLAIPKPIEDNYKEIDKRLKEIKIVDPAVGSGAFPVGMMNEIVKARSILTIFFDDDEQKKRTVYKFKREAIENSLYGVDIDSSAVDIAKLRFWLSLIVDEEDIKIIKPLPNLDHKIMCGNSLLEEFEGVKLFDETILIDIPKDYSYQLEQIDNEANKLNQELHDIHTGKKADNGRKEQIQRELNNLKRNKQQILSGPNEDVPQVTLDEAFQKRMRESQKKLAELKQLQRTFFNEQNRGIKKKLRADIERIEWELIAETLKEQGNEEAMQKLLQYQKNKSKPFFLWELYFAEVFQRENPGFDVVIANPPYVRVDDLARESRDNYKKIYTTAIGKYDLYYLFFEKSIPLSNYNGTFVFITPNKFCAANSAKVLRDLIFGQTFLGEVISTSKLKVFESASNYPIISIIQKTNISRGFSIREAKDVDSLGYNDLHSGYHLSEAEYNLLPDHVVPINIDQNSFNLLKRVFEKSEPLSRIVSISEGLRIPKRLESDSVQDFEIIKQYQFSKYSEISDGTYLSAKNLKTILSENSKRYQKIIKDKIVIAEDALEISATIDLKKRIPQGGVYFAVVVEPEFNIKFVLGLLNSNLFTCLYSMLYSGMHMGGGYLRYRSRFLENLPLPKDLFENTSKHGKPVIDLVDQILSITKDDDYLDKPDEQAKVKKLEEQIDKLVYELYELTPEEIEIVGTFNEGK